ncbi:MAG: molybdate ABC transporter substrate-binding protein [Pelagibacterales bacterium]|nr:molybdate ABC transporter substrate-binding protein [Pelagibacterales bacterium]
MVNAVPAGIYAREFFENIGIWKSIKSNVANSPNVRAALSFVSRGDLEYGVVYKSDAVADKRVKVIYNLDPNLYTKVQYPITVLNEKKYTIRIYDFLKGKKAAQIFKKWGFIVKSD